MAYIEWSESLSVGVEFIDHEHKTIIALMNRLYDHYVQEEHLSILKSAIKTLVEYTQYHFSHEEMIMDACHYPEIPSHHHQHTLLLQKVTDIAEQFHTNPSSIDKDKLLIFLKEWLINHILKEDMAYRPYCEYNQNVEKLVQKLKNDSLRMNERQ